VSVHTADGIKRGRSLTVVAVEGDRHWTPKPFGDIQTER
jgi:hypothetical protein